MADASGGSSSVPPRRRVFKPADIGPVHEIPVFNIRNGDASDARSVLMRPTIPAAFHWVPIDNLKPEDALNHTEAFIRSAEIQMKENDTAKRSAALQRKIAIILGVSRAVMCAYYGILQTDLIPGEKAAPKMTIVAAENGTKEIVPMNGMSDEALEIFDRDVSYDDTEKAVISVLLTSTIGTLPLQGYSLMMCNHHYLSARDTQSRKAFETVERQFWKQQAVTSWFSDDVEAIRDAVWHKAGHPVNISVKERVATDPRVAAMVREAGVGSAAARLPALEPEIRAANSYKTLFSTVRPFFNTYGGYINFDVLLTAMDIVKLYAHGVDSASITRPPAAPEYVNNRRTAILYLADVTNRNSDVAAYCYGFYCAISDQNQAMGGSITSDTLKTSYSLTKLKTQSFASFVAGQQAFGDYTAAKTAIRQKGDYIPPEFTLG